MPDIEVPVLIVGGSLVGMSTALLLGHHGIRSLAVEHHRGTAIHPRAAMITQRTMEVLRTVGVEQIVMRKSDEQFVQDGAIMALETLAGKELASFIANLNEGVRDVSPSLRLFITQSLLEPLLKSRAVELGAELRFATELVSFEEDREGVTAVIRERDSGKTATVRARYMVAADGSHSKIRNLLGIRMLGHGVFSNSITIYFHGDVAPLLRGRSLSVMYVLNPVLSGFFRIEKPFTSGFLAVHWMGDPKNPVTDVSQGLTDERCLELLRAALGDDKVPVTIDSVMHWDAAADTAERFQQGRVFLAGDSAHVMPPSGGFGGNTGVQDAHNLAWKLAFVLKGIAGPDLLPTYDRERRPAAGFTVEQAYSRYVTRSAPYLRSEKMQAIENDLNIEFGYVYHSAAVIPEDASDTRAHENPRQSKGRPGTRAPHLYLQRRAQQISTLDLFGRNFVLLAGPEGNAWCESARAAAKQLGIDVDVHQMGASGLTDPSGGFAAAYGIAPTGAVLVRPDGFVAWRAKNAEGATSQRLASALASVLCRRA
ncbi:MAG TPA: FAD-dependent monooxygenase [Candidatus Acidoferrales bacterium]|nr:FAD-dependent monooxygenase [Candidatus Acidoferrales bacterium]